jgi:hypothetical protein
MCCRVYIDYILAIVSIPYVFRFSHVAKMRWKFETYHTRTIIILLQVLSVDDGCRNSDGQSWKPKKLIIKFHILRLSQKHKASNFYELYFYVTATKKIHIHTYHSRFIPEGVAEVSQIFPRDTPVLPKLVSYEEHCSRHKW